MKLKIAFMIAIGAGVALAGSLLMLLLLALHLVGPASVKNDRLMYGGTLLFISLYIFLLVGLFYGLRKVKQLNGGGLTFLQAVTSGFYVSLSTAVFSVIFTVAFYEMIYPEYNQQMAEIITSKMKNSNLNPVEISGKVAEQTQYYSTWVQAKFAFVGNLITGIAFSVLLSLFLKTKNKTAQPG
jgi:hypothetical protein